MTCAKEPRQYNSGILQLDATSFSPRSGGGLSFVSLWIYVVHGNFLDYTKSLLTLEVKRKRKNSYSGQIGFASIYI